MACCCCPTGRMIGPIRWEQPGRRVGSPPGAPGILPSPPQTTRRRSVSEHPVWTPRFRPLASMRSYRTQKQHNASPVALSSHATPQNGREGTIIGGLSEPQLNHPTTPLGPEVFVRKTRACLGQTNHMYSRSWRSRFEKKPAALFAPPTPASPISLPNLARSSSVTLLFQFSNLFFSLLARVPSQNDAVLGPVSFYFFSGFRVAYFILYFKTSWNMKQQSPTPSEIHRKQPGPELLPMAEKPPKTTDSRQHL